MKPTGKLTEDEGWTLLRGTCPDCKAVGLIAGPRGGMSQNVLCANCHTEFLATVIPSWCERMEPPGPRRMKDIYKIEDHRECLEV